MYIQPFGKSAGYSSASFSAFQRVGKTVAGVITTASLSLATIGLVHGAEPVVAITTSSQPAVASQYTVGTKTYNYGTGSDIFIDSATVMLNGEELVLKALAVADSVAVKRVESNSTGENAAGVKGERLYFQYEGADHDTEVMLKPSRMLGMDEVFASARVNIGAGDLFCNEGIYANNIERLDFVINEGVVAPPSTVGLEMVGYIISERLGNNPYSLAAITELSPSGEPVAFGPVYIADPGHYGPALFDPEPEYRMLRTPTDSSIPDLKPVSFFGVDQQWHGQFNSLSDLGLNPGQKFYGVAMFPADVSDAMDLVGLSDVPLDTSDNGFDCADHFGDTGLLIAATALGSIGDLVWNDLDEDGEVDDFESGLSGVSLDLMIDTDGDGDVDENDYVVDTQVTDAEGKYTFKNLFPGNYYVVVTDSQKVLEQHMLVSGQSPLSVDIAADEAYEAADFGYRQDVQIGLAKELVGISRVGPSVYDVEFRFHLENLNPKVDALNVQMEENFATTFTDVASFELFGSPIISGGLTRLNPVFDGDPENGDNPGHIKVLTGDETLAAGETAQVQMVVRVDLGTATGPFENQAYMSSHATPAGFLLDDDLSDDGSSSTPTPGGNPSGPGADDPTPVPLVAEPRIGTGKEASLVTNHQDGTWSTTFTLVVKNMGNTPLYDVQLRDNLVPVFGEVVDDVIQLNRPGTYVITSNSLTGGGLTLNPSYDGQNDVNLFDLSAGGVLLPEASATITLVVRFVDDPSKSLPLLNQSEAMGDVFANSNGVADANVSDLSHDDIDNLTPSSVEEDDPTPIPFAPAYAVGLAKSVAEISVDTYPELHAHFTLLVENVGNQLMQNVLVEDDLSETFPAELTKIIAVENLAVTGSLQANPAFDGVNDKQLLSAASTLGVGSRETITFTVRFELLTDVSELSNQAEVTASSVSGEVRTDLSDDGSVIDPDNDGNANEPGENDPTPIILPELPSVITVTKAASRNEVKAGDVLTYSVKVSNNVNATIDDLEIVDLAPPGFNLKEGTVTLIRAGADGKLGSSDDVKSALSPVVSGRADMRFPDFALAGQEQIEIRYVMQVTTGVTVGDYYNRAFVEDQADIVISNVARAGVRVVQDPLLEKTTIIGKVFHDRDGDGHQDPAGATGLRLESPQFVNGVRHLGDLDGRVRESDPLSEHQIQLRIPHHGFVLKTNEGTVLNVDRHGAVVETHEGDVAKGFNNQKFTVAFSHDGYDPVVTITNVGLHEEGIPGVRLATVQGLLVETDLYGRYHLADVETGREDRSGLFVVKVDPSTLPEGTEFTTENPRVLRLGKSLMTKFNFGVKLPDVKPPMHDIKVPEKRIVRETIDMEGLIPDVLFDSGKADLRPDGERILRATVNTLRGKESVKLNVIGHTDSQRLSLPTQYSFGTNYGLGQARADAVAAYLQSHLGLAETNAQGYTWGEDKPIASNKTPEGMQLNRRAVVNPSYEQTSLKKVMVDKRVRIPHGGVIWATEDPLKLDPRLAIDATAPLVIAEDGSLDAPDFRVYSNYLAYLDRWEIEIFDELDLAQLEPLAVLKGKVLSNSRAIHWDGKLMGHSVRDGDKLNYRLRVYDTEGRFDETHLRDLAVIDQRLTKQRIKRQQTVSQDDGEDTTATAIFGENQLMRQTIPLNGSRVRVHGADLHSDYQLLINGETVTVDDNHRFVLEQLLPEGTHRFDLQVTDTKGLDWNHAVGVDVRGEYLFMVGLANLTVGKNNVSGHVEPLNGDEHYDESTFVDGRAAFYLKGKVKGKYLVTAQLDTTEDQLNNLGDQLKRKNPQELLRSLDPDAFYPVYGDDSTTISDVDTQGAFYVRVDWDKSQALWGNFHSGITGTELAQYNRTLYGAQLLYKTTDLTTLGDHRSQWNVFASEAQTAMGHNRFRATGGSLYYLREQDIVRGSEKIWVEVREQGTERVIETVEMSAGSDYEIDYLQGRILLSRPLSQYSSSKVSTGSLISDQAMETNPVLLMVDFEYIPDSFSGDEVTAGIRGKHWLNDHVAVGGTYISEDRSVSTGDYSLGGLDVTLQGSRGTWLKAEFARSEATQTSGGWLSDNGGLSFVQVQDILDDDRDGDAVSLEGQINLSELSAGEVKGRVAAWWKQRDAGFSTARTDDGLETTDGGIRVDWDANSVLRLTLSANALEKESDTSKREDEKVSVQARVRTSENLDVLAEVSQDIDKVTTLATGVTDKSEATLGAVGLELRINEHARVTASVQTVIDDNGNYDDNDRLSIGVRDQITDRLALKGEVSAGDRGDALQLGADYQVNDQFNVQVEAGVGDAATSEIGSRYYTVDGTELYGSYTVSGDRTDLPGETVTLGQRKRLGASTAIFNEERFSDNDEESGIAHVFGIEHKVSKSVSVTGGLQHSEIEDHQNQEIRRDTASAGVTFRDRQFKASSRLEYRKDESDTSDDDNTTQWLTANSAEWKVSPHLKWLIRLNFSETENDLSGKTVARFVEGDLGLAFRPAFSDRLNVLAKYSRLYDLPSLGQDSLRADEKSHVLSFEGLYDLTGRWEVGGKLAWRKGETREEREDGEWFDSGARLALIRTRYHFVKRWDAMAEYRVLEAESGDDRRHGGLMGVYRHFGRNLRVGLGYNFTEFDDDLKRLDYDSEGWFVDIVGQF